MQVRLLAQCMAFGIMGAMAADGEAEDDDSARPIRGPMREAQAAFVLVAAVCGSALRSRVRRFESCWGRKIEHVR
jgi:hypothetical protein